MSFELLAVIKALVRFFLLPPSGPLLVVFAGLWVARRRRWGLALAAAGALALWIAATPLVSNALLATLSPAAPLHEQAARGAQAIVILGGGLRRDAAEYGGDTLGRLTSERVRYGAVLVRRLGLPVLVTGGRSEPDSLTEAEVMKAALESEHGVPVRWMEDEARNTHENAQLSARILQAEGVKRVVLVMHGFDVPRAAAEFRAAGLDVVPAATQLPNHEPWRAADFLPSVFALGTTYWVLYEYLGLAAAHLRG